MSAEETRKRCAQCGRPYREGDNAEGACRYHPGWLKDYDRVGQIGEGAPGDFWSCCMAMVDDTGGLSAPGCAGGRHVEAVDSDPGPVARDVQRSRNAMEEVLRNGGLWGPKESLDAAKAHLSRFLCEQLPIDAAETESHTHLLELYAFAWLLDQLSNPHYAIGRRGVVAGFVKEDENFESLRLALSGASAERARAELPPAGERVFRLRVRGRAANDQTFTLADGEVTIGRSTACAVCPTLRDGRHHDLHDHHATIAVVDGRARLSDVTGRIDATQVNGRYVLDAELNHGDVIRCGDVSFELLVERRATAEDAALLVHADELLARGDLRGELIALHLRPAARPSAALAERKRELLALLGIPAGRDLERLELDWGAEPAERWTEALAAEPFLRSIRVDGALFWARQDRPIHGAPTYPAPDVVGALAGAPLLMLQELALLDVELSNVAAIASAPFAATLEVLDSSGNRLLDDAGLEPLLRAPPPRLRRLVLRRCGAITAPLSARLPGVEVQT